MLATLSLGFAHAATPTLKLTSSAEARQHLIPDTANALASVKDVPNGAMKLADITASHTARKAPRKAPGGVWHTIGTGTFSDNLFNAFGQGNATWNVEIERSATNPAWYRLAPFTADASTAISIAGVSDPSSYMYIDTTDPANVKFDDFSCYDGAIVFTQSYLNQFGTLADNVITFPQKSIVMEYNSGAYYANSNGPVTIYLPGADVKDYSMEMQHYNFCTPDNKHIVNFATGADIASVKLRVVSGRYNVSNNANNVTYVVQNGDTFNPTDGALTININAATYDPGIYTVLAVGLDAEGTVQAAREVNFIVAEDATTGWKTLGTTTYKEILYSGSYTGNNTPAEIEVTVMESTTTPGRYYLVNPYATFQFRAEGVALPDHGHVHGIIINATIPTQVYVEATPLGFNYDGEGAAFSLAGEYLSSGTSAADVEAEGLFGTATTNEDGSVSVSMPAGSVSLGEKNYANGKFYVSSLPFAITIPSPNAVFDFSSCYGLTFAPDVTLPTEGGTSVAVQSISNKEVSIEAKNAQIYRTTQAMGGTMQYRVNSGDNIKLSAAAPYAIKTVRIEGVKGIGNLTVTKNATVTSDNATPYTVAEAIAQNNSGAEVWVEGYIVGWYDINNLKYPLVTTLDGEVVATNIALADNASEITAANTLAIQLPAGDLRTALNLKNNPANLGKKVAIKGKLMKYFGICGLKECTEFKIEGVAATTAYGSNCVEFTLPTHSSEVEINVGSNAQITKITVMTEDMEEEAKAILAQAIVGAKNELAKAKEAGLQAINRMLEIPALYGAVDQLVALADAIDSINALSIDFASVTGVEAITPLLDEAKATINGYVSTAKASAHGQTFKVRQMLDLNAWATAWENEDMANDYLIASNDQLTFAKLDEGNNVWVIEYTPEGWLMKSNNQYIGFGSSWYTTNSSQEAAKFEFQPQSGDATLNSTLSNVLHNPLYLDYLGYNSAAEAMDTTNNVRILSDSKYLSRQGNSVVNQAPGADRWYAERNIWKLIAVDKTNAIESVTENMVKSSTIYDLQGRRLSTPTHGLNIINGRKVYVK